MGRESELDARAGSKPIGGCIAYYGALGTIKCLEWEGYYHLSTYHLKKQSLLMVVITPTILRDPLMTTHPTLLQWERTAKQGIITDNLYSKTTQEFLPSFEMKASIYSKK